MAATQSIRVLGPRIDIVLPQTLESEDFPRLLDRLFAHNGTRTVTLDAPGRRIRVRLFKDRSPREALQSFAELILEHPTSLESLPKIASERRMTLYRWQGVVTWLHLIDLSAGKVAVKIPKSHRGLLSPGTLQRLPGIYEVRERRFVNRLVVSYDPKVDPSVWVRTLERMLDPTAQRMPAVVAPKIPFLMANTNLALSATSQFLYPPTLPLVCVVLLASRGSQFAKAAREMGHGKIGAPFYSSVVVACSVATLSPFASALAEWLTRIWERKAGRVISHETRELLATLPESMAISDPSGPPPEVVLRAGDPVPFDGILKEGDLLVRDGLFSDALSAPLLRKRQGEALVSGYRVIGGQGTLEPHHDREDRMSSVVRVVSELPATLTEDEALRGESRRLGDLTVYPNLALAGVAYALGGLHMAGAILHQDWTASPMLAAPTEFFRDLRAGLSHGALVMTPGALTGLSKTSVLLFDSAYPGLGELRPRVMDLESPPKPISRANAWAHLLADWIGDARSEAMLDLAKVSDTQAVTATLIQHGDGRTLLSIDGIQVTLEDLPTSGEWPSLRIAIEGEADEVVHFGPTDIPRLARTFQRLRSIGVATALYGPSSDSIGSRLGVDAVYPDLNASTLKSFRENLQAQGYTSAQVTHRPPDASIDPDPGVVIGPLRAIEGLNAPTIQLLGDSLDSLFELMLASRTLKLRMGVASLRTIPTNLLCILGAFSGTLNGTMTTAIAHTGVLGVSWSQARRVKKSRKPGHVF